MVHVSNRYLDLEPVMSVRGRVTRVIYPNVGDGVGYGLTWRVPKQNIQVATVPIGYADGLARELSNQMEVIVDGMRCRQVGNICMDQFMIDVGDDTLAEGDEVLLFGSGAYGEPTTQEWADSLGTITHEIVTRIGARVPRVYR